MIMTLLRIVFLAGLVAAVTCLGYLGWMTRSHD
jgi:hypothetical protein